MRIGSIRPEYEFDDEDSIDLACFHLHEAGCVCSVDPCVFVDLQGLCRGVVARTSTSSQPLPETIVSQQGYVPPQPFRYDGFSHGGDVGSSQVPVFSTHCTDTASIGEETPSERRERKKWTLTKDVVLISAWLNTNKDPVVGNEQRAGAFWKRIAAYFAASPKVQGGEKRESIQSSSKLDGSCKKRKCDDGAQSSSSHATTNDGEQRPPGVKASKRGSGKRTNEDLKDLSEIKSLWAIKEKDLEVKERLSKMGLLETLIAKKEPLSEFEEALKTNLISEMRLSVVLIVALYQAATLTEGFNVKSVSMASSSHNDSDNFDQAFDQYFDERFDQTYENLVVPYSGQQEERPERKKRVYIERNYETCHIRLWNDYFSDTPMYPENLFRRRFRMNRRLFMHIVDRLSNEVHSFRQKKDAIRVLAYGTAADTVDEYLRLGETTTRACVEKFVEGIINLFGDEYLRRPTPADLQRLLDIIPQGLKAVLFAQRQEAVRKDVERAFGVLQARFAIVKNPSLFLDKVKIENIMRACIILHNMIVEDERDGYTQFNVSEFQQGEEAGSSYVDLMYFTDMPSNIVNMMGVRTQIRDKQMHQRLKADLVEHIWRKFGRDEDNN
uniref:No apical meristem-associated C-terminal domain-containing protein n=1 Tax=Brassica oleracea TaxID=3712 RepID=B2D2H9_BRAOL|nr:unknown protein [Brassica oleracea]